MQLPVQLPGAKRLFDIYRQVRHAGSQCLASDVLARLNIRAEIPPRQLDRIPARGPVVLVANHPFGLLEGAVLCSVLPRVRADFRILANSMLSVAPELDRFCIFVDPFARKKTVAANALAVRRALQWLEEGGVLVIFPAGEVSRFNPLLRRAIDRSWSDTAARLIRRTGATAVPVYFSGSNSLPFHLLGFLHPSLQTAALPAEFLNKRNAVVSPCIGRPIPASALAGLDDAGITSYLRWQTYLLSARREENHPSLRRFRRSRPVIPSAPGETLAAEIDSLPVESRLLETPDYLVCAARSFEIPSVLNEIGRLREISFRAAGEGTGRQADLDSFDRSYHHLFLFHKQNREIAGAYRIGLLSELVVGGSARLYTRTLFTYGREFLQRLGPAAELGRSFVRLEYQKKYLPLFLLWRGICEWIWRHPEVATLFGAVSVSKRYCAASRELIFEYLQAQAINEPLARFVKPRRAFRPHYLRSYELDALPRALSTLDELDEHVSEIESDGKGVPILIKQYARLGARIIAFTVDGKFSDTLDGLAVVDLRRTDEQILAKYMGEGRARAFLEAHSQGIASRRLAPQSGPMRLAG